MAKRGCVRQGIFGRLNLELKQSNMGIVIFCGALWALAGVLMKAFGASPYPVLLALGVQELVPPVWLMALLWTLSFFTVGCAAGIAFSCRTCRGECEKYKAALLFLLLFVLELLWYPTLFSGMLLFLSALLALLILGAAVFLSVILSRIGRLAAVILIFHDVWLAYLLILNFVILFRS